MNKTSICYFSLAAIAIGSLASCQDYDAGFDDPTKIAYESAFRKEFGSIDPEHNWGFDPIPAAVIGAKTRAVNPEINQWESVYHLNVPGGVEGSVAKGDVTDDEREYVYWWFSTHKNPRPLDVNWTDFFVQEVWGQPEHIAGQPLGMDQVQYWFDDIRCDHVLNFNTAGAQKEHVEYVYEGSTFKFSYNSSYATVGQDGSNSNKIYKNYTLQYINGNYYLGFDLEAHKPGEATGCSYPSGTCPHDINCIYEVKNTGKCKHGTGEPCVPRDGYYNDWIIKLTPGLHKVDDASKRIMCEDLGGSFDWDFQDLVFDVAFVDDYLGDGYQTTAIITLQAAGGTLPIYFGQGGSEAHALFGVQPGVVVNAVNNPDGVKSVSRPPVVFHYRGNFTVVKSETVPLANGGSTTVNYYDANEVPIFVSESAHDLDKGERNPLRALETYKGSTPEKFGCSTDVKWMAELMHIKDGYSGFADWVQAANPSTSETPWYKTTGSNYYAASVVTSTAGSYKPNDWINDPHQDKVYEWSELCNEINWNSLSDATEKSFERFSPNNSDQ